ncbi:MAG: tRNA pseudouridine(13) synthase TruD [Desulfuromonas sp.]|nr:MAG: tRNA pseudouridine(13) synthase TruD [Desulfuromonas sp.]
MTEYLTADLPGIGGIMKESVEDFFVEELPLYLPSGEGEHLYLRLEKRGMSTFELVRQVGAALGVKEREIGYAGLKDARATTRQTLSLPGVSPETAQKLEIPGVTLLEASRHRNKLRLGHLAGNRFRIRLKQVAPQAKEKTKTILEVLSRRGVPNRFGIQRYGVLGNSHRIGGALLRRDFETALREVIGDPEKIDNPRWQEAARCFAASDLDGALAAFPPRFRDERRLLHALKRGETPQQALLALPRKLLNLYLSAWQSALFDQQVAARINELDRLRGGDLAMKHENGACFHVDDPAAEQPRADRLEISPTAPLFVRKVTPAQGEVGETERALLATEGLDVETFVVASGISLDGERRAMRVPIADATVTDDADDGLLVQFSLPKGSYATSVLAEIMK